MSKKNIATPTVPANLAATAPLNTVPAPMTAPAASVQIPAIPAATAPLNTVPAPMTAPAASVQIPAIPAATAALNTVPANNNFLAILAAILVSLNGQPGISVLIPSLLPSLQTLVQNAAAAAQPANAAVSPTAAATPANAAQPTATATPANAIQPAAPAPATSTPAAVPAVPPVTATASATATATAHASARACKARHMHLSNVISYYEFMTRNPMIRFKFPCSRALAQRLLECGDFPRSNLLNVNCEALAAMNLTGLELEGFYRTWHTYSEGSYIYPTAAMEAQNTAE